MKKTYLTTLMVAVVLTGCSSFKKTETIIETKIEKPPAALLVSCPIPKPIDKKVYMGYTWSQKEQAWVTTVADLYAALRKCNSQVTGIRDWSDKLSKASSIHKTDKSNTTGGGNSRSGTGRGGPGGAGSPGGGKGPGGPRG